MVEYVYEVGIMYDVRGCDRLSSMSISDGDMSSCHVEMFLSCLSC